MLLSRGARKQLYPALSRIFRLCCCVGVAVGNFFKIADEGTKPEFCARFQGFAPGNFDKCAVGRCVVGESEVYLQGRAGLVSFV